MQERRPRGVLPAPESFVYDGPAKILAYIPAVQKGNLKGFFTAAEGRRNISRERYYLR
ncbi:MAG: hypothetical protein JST63_08005 [Bacteroidetes bacterium]|nr:hypothetical protein [Bacteroidota bacterium]